jgi:hypothetical protein
VHIVAASVIRCTRTGAGLYLTEIGAEEGVVVGDNNLFAVVLALVVLIYCCRYYTSGLNRIVFGPVLLVRESWSDEGYESGLCLKHLGGSDFRLR